MATAVATRASAASTTREQLTFVDFDIPLTVQFHPSRNLLAVGLVSGLVHCYSKIEEDDCSGSSSSAAADAAATAALDGDLAGAKKKKKSSSSSGTNRGAGSKLWKRISASKHHRDGVRSLCFSEDGSHLYTASSDRSIQALDVETYMVCLKKSKAHDDAINVITQASGMSKQHIIVSGDDNGHIRIWDLRDKREVMKFRPHSSSVNGLCWIPQSNETTDTTLASCSGDGTITVHDLRNTSVGTLLYQSPTSYDDELMCLSTIKNHNNRLMLLAGVSNGTLLSWKCDDYEAVVNRIPGHKDSVDSMITLGSQPSCLITGSTDGNVRIVNPFSGGRVNCVSRVGKHEEDFPIDGLCLSHDETYLASSSHDGTVKIWELNSASPASSRSSSNGEVSCKQGKKQEE